MSKIISIATEVPQFKHTQEDLLEFMKGAYSADDKQKRILSYLYKHSGIETRYSVIPDFTLPMDEWKFFPKSTDLEPFPNLEYRMKWFKDYALPLSLQSATKCMSGIIEKEEITHLITVSCTGMSAPGLDLQLMWALGLNKNITRTSVNFMGCFAAIHGLKMANDIVTATPASKVLVVCTELCSLHFQKIFSEDTITAPLLFGDGSASALVCGDDYPVDGVRLDSFYSEVVSDGQNSMTWDLSSNGFVMTLSADVPELFRTDIGPLKEHAIAKSGYSADAIKYWCIHPGGKRILQAIRAGLSLTEEDLANSYEVLRKYGNMSSATVLFVLKSMWNDLMNDEGAQTFAAAFGPGLTMESIIMTAVPYVKQKVKKRSISVASSI
jgi:predicted naringenin-chalcone synthase